MTDIRPDSIQFWHKITLFGIVLMVRTAEPSGCIGVWEFGRWRKAKYYDLPRLNAHPRGEQA